MGRKVENYPNDNDGDDDGNDVARLFWVVLEELDYGQEHDEHEEYDHRPLHYLDGFRAVRRPGPEAGDPEEKSQEVGEQCDCEHEPDKDIEKSDDLRKGGFRIRDSGEYERKSGEKAEGGMRKTRQIGRHTQYLFLAESRNAEGVGRGRLHLACRRIVEAPAEERVLQQTQNAPDGDHDEEHDDAPEEVGPDLLRRIVAEI